MRVLLAEDDLGLQHIYGRILRDSGCDVVTASNGEDALNLLKNELFDVALLDILLPKVNGMQLLEYAVSAEHLTEMRIVLMSANRSYEPQVKQYPRAHFLPKPFQLTQLRDLIAVLV
ncbi:MAG: response regulator [bacterium]|nr:response regulator [bacterium]